MLSLVGSNVTVYASSSSTESTAGITLDEINEMSQNSPHSLTPTQGLVLWMFAILAFLKLAQKMDSLLQSLGLNVTQTGGRAVGDLLMAGMALKNVGSAFSKGMGMLGFGRGSGSGGSATGTGSGTGTRSAGGSGSSPIPTGSPGSNSGGSSAGGRTAPGGTHSSGGSHGNGSGASPQGTSTTSGTSGVVGAGSRNPIGRFVGWMRKDGFAQGAIKAGAKGGVIGVGAYAAKAGASKIGSAVSARFSGDGISSNPKGTAPNNKNANAPNNQQPIDTNKNVNNDVRGDNTTKNPEDYQTAKPLDGTEDQALIPAAINSEAYQDTKPSDSADASSSTFSSSIDEGYVDSYDTVSDSQPIPATVESDSGDISKSATNHSPTDANNAEWQDARPVDGSGITAPIPTTVSNEDWNDSSPISQSSTTPSTVSDTSSMASPSLPVKPAVQDTAAIQIGAASGVATPSSPQTQQSVATTKQSPDTMQGKGLENPSTGESAIKQGTPTNIGSSGNPSVGSSESISTVSETPSLQGGSSAHSVHHSSPVKNNDVASYDSTSMPTQNHAIPGRSPQNTVQLSGLSHDIPAGGNAGGIGGGVSASSTIQQAPIQSNNSVINADSSVNTSIPQSDAARSSHAQAAPDVIRTELPSTGPVQGADAVSVNGSVPVQTNTDVQSQTSQVNNYAKPDVSTQANHTTQTASQVVQVEKQGFTTQFATQPTAAKGDESTPKSMEKGKSETPPTRGRKRRR